jgi:glucosamine--fructose-6-phosphate aminotransferase (isomerizing)
MGRFLAVCQVFIGKNPISASAPALIFFPVMTFQLNCGFAGLMTFQPNKKITDLTDDLELAELWKKIKSSCLKNALTGKITPEAYLNGLETLNSMEKTALELKQESKQEILFFQTGRAKKLFGLVEKMKLFLAEEEKMLEDNAAKFSSADLEIINSRIVLLKDIQWILEKDILDNFAKIIDLSDAKEITALNPAAFKKYRQINLLLNALDRLEVRGRDSAGLQIVFTLKKGKDMESILLNLKKKGLYEDYLMRSQDGDIVNGSIWVAPHAFVAAEKRTTVTFTYKTFSIVGELGRNSGDLKQTIKKDQIFQCFAQMDTVCETALMHTRWASVGSITEENCHPINNYKLDQKNPHFPFYQSSVAHINVVLNGDIDNYPALRASLSADKELIAPEVTTDTKIIPLQIEKYLKAGQNVFSAQGQRSVHLCRH